MNELLEQYHAFHKKFKDGHGDWTPTKEDWQQQAEVERHILLETLEQFVPNLPSDHLRHCERYIPAHLSTQSFFETVVAMLVQGAHR